MTALAPVPPRERVVSLDVLRGFALLGVMIGNLGLYNGRWAERGGAPHATWLDELARWLVAIFVESKAQTLLTLLFGFGFAIQLLRAQERHEPVMALYVRRLVVLFAIGLLHLTLLWWGDVTWTYAITGFGLLAFHRASNRVRVVAAVIFIFVPFAIVRLPGMWAREIAVVLDPSEMATATRQMLAAIHSPSHDGLAWMHLHYALVWAAQLWGWYFWWLLGRFLLGYVAGKNRWFDDDGVHCLPVFRRMLWWGLAGGAIGTAHLVVAHLRLLAGYDLPIPVILILAVVQQIGMLSMAITYVATVVLLVQRPRWRRVLQVVAPVGRMPLTTYLSQSLACTFVFYGWGLGWAGSVGDAGCLGLALGIFAVQVVACRLWLRYFRFGPVEWLWRWLVYLKPPPMRVARPPASTP